MPWHEICKIYGESWIVFAKDVLVATLDLKFILQPASTITRFRLDTSDLKSIIERAKDYLPRSSSIRILGEACNMTIKASV